ncbi:SCO2322 family protein [Streptomyces sp. P17]|uniref:SCO2322 family protein n=1 Tax=Streptomyces sp. P17 TaxID=3074716 RepID=UPI0028F4293E|nr:SCO2322 family protein [Streptomyces sp. P17]MDT9698508.1 SCO2322 family protein [Streptomyces sp. P17]
MIRRAGALLLATLALCAATPSAQAASYRYWSFWDREGSSWMYATQGPSMAVPSDGDVQGFRFTLSEDSSDAATPRSTANFGTVCARTPAQDGRKRVALVIDFGTKSESPSGETPPKLRTACARVAEDATTAEALASVAKPLRYDSNALLCAIAGYPSAGCGEQVAKTTNKNTKKNDNPSVGLWAGAAGVATLGAAAIWQARRRRA